MKALFKSINLIGDALYISPALRVWTRTHTYPDWDVYIQTLNDHVTRLYDGMLDRPSLIKFERSNYEFDFEHTFDVSQAFQLSDRKQQHIAESYADLLGVELDRKPDMSHVGPFYEPPQEQTLLDDELGLILVSMFSASCSSRGNPPGPANKMISWMKWKPILRTIRKAFPGTPVRFLGAPTDQVPDAMGIIEPGEYMLGIPLDRLAMIMKHCKFLVTLDSGMAHLAASQKAKEFVFYPRVLGTHYILPKGNPNMRYMHMDPNTLNPVEAIWNLNQAWKDWGLVHD